MQAIFPSGGIPGDTDWLWYINRWGARTGDLEDGRSVVTRDFHNRSKAEIIALATAMGSGVTSTYDTLEDRLDSLLPSGSLEGVSGYIPLWISDIDLGISQIQDDGTTVTMNYLQVDQDGNIGGALSVSGDVQMGADAYVGNDLVVSGVSNLIGNAHLLSDATVGEDFNIGGITTASGNATFLGVLLANDIISNTNVFGSHIIGNAITSSGSIIADDAISASGRISAGGNIIASGSIGVGTDDPYDTLTISDPVPAVRLEYGAEWGRVLLLSDGLLSITSTGEYVQVYRLDASGNLQVREDITTDGNIFASGNITTSGSVEIDGDLTVHSTATFNNIATPGWVHASGTIESSGNISASGQLTAGGDLITSGYLIVNGNYVSDIFNPTYNVTVRDLSSPTIILERGNGSEYTLISTGVSGVTYYNSIPARMAVFNGSIDCVWGVHTGRDIVTDANIHASGEITTSGNVVIDGGLTVGSGTTLSTLTTTDWIYSSGNIDSEGSISASGEMNSGGDLTSSGNAHILGDITVDDSLIVGGVGHIGTNLQVSGNIVASGNVGVSGILTVGAGDYTTIDSSGFLRIYNGDGPWDDLRVSAASLKINPFTSKPDYGNYLGGPLSAFLFDGGSEEAVTFAAQLPHNWKEDTEFEAHVHWSPTTATIGTVIWGLQYVIGAISGTMSPLTTIESSSNTAGDPTMHHYNDIGDIDPSGLGVSSQLVCRLYRDGAADDYPDDVALLELDFHYQVDTLGSKAEFGRSSKYEL